jgi:hypothetical protein
MFFSQVIRLNSQAELPGILHWETPARALCFSTKYSAAGKLEGIKKDLIFSPR